MTRTARWTLLTIAAALAVFTGRFVSAQAPPDAAAVEASFEKIARPFLKQNCLRCHDGETSMAGVRIDLLDGKVDDRQIDTWEAARKRIANGTMPPKGAPQPSDTDRERMTRWIDEALEYAGARPAAKTEPRSPPRRVGSRDHPRGRPPVAHLRRSPLAGRFVDRYDERPRNAPMREPPGIPGQEEPA